MGLAKHRKSGKAPKSPKLRYALRLQAEGRTNAEAPVERKGKHDARAAAWRRKRAKRNGSSHV